MSDKFEGTARNIGGKIEDAAGGLTGDSRTQAQGKIDQVAGQAQQAYGDAKEKVSAAASDASATVSDMAKRASEQASDLGEQVYQQGAQAAQYVGGQLREHSTAAIIAAGAIGVIVGYLLGRPPHERAIQVGRARLAYRD